MKVYKVNVYETAVNRVTYVIEARSTIAALRKALTGDTADEQERTQLEVINREIGRFL